MATVNLEQKAVDDSLKGDDCCGQEIVGNGCIRKTKPTGVLINTMLVDHEYTKAHKQNFSEAKWKRFSEWIHCICVVTFDLELGQAMEFIYPEHVKLSEQEKINICYLAFPDSNSGCMGDTQFHIRLRVAPGTSDTLLNFVHRRFNTHCLPVQRADNGHYYGFVYFRQTKDATLPRGYFQKSFIILTRLPFFNLFYEICSLIAPRYFFDGFPVLQMACKQICNWPELKAGNALTLHLLGNMYQTFIPKINSSHMESNNSSSSKISKDEDEGEENPCTDCNCNNSDNANDSDNGDNNSINNINTTTDDVDKLQKKCNKHDHVCQVQNQKQQQQQQEENVCILGPQLPPQILNSVHELDIFRSLSSVISHIHLLWELVLTAEPIVVMGTSPTDCSHMVQSLISMISPLAYCAESRPYFTIHDSEFKEFTQRLQGPPSIIIGVTNPFFTKPLENWPHLIRLVDQTSLNGSMQGSIILGGGGGGANITSSNIIISKSGSSNISCNNSGQNLSNNLTISSSKLRKIRGFNSKSLDNLPGVYTKYKPFLQKDKSVIKKIMHGIKTKRPPSVQSALLRRHLLELTQSFMIPLERYIASLMPLQKDISPFKAAPNPNQFKQDDFLATLEQSGPHLTSPLKGDWEGLYKRFFRSPNFKGWYENRDMELRQTLQALQLQALSDADLNKWAQGKHEVEIVDMILKLKQKLKLCSESQSSSSGGSCSQIIGSTALKDSTRNQLMKHLENMKQTLPDDLKTILNDT